MKISVHSMTETNMAVFSVIQEVNGILVGSFVNVEICDCVLW